MVYVMPSDSRQQKFKKETKRRIGKGWWLEGESSKYFDRFARRWREKPKKGRMVEINLFDEEWRNPNTMYP